MSEKRCNKCGDVLVVGDNWMACHAKYRNYMCKKCNTIRQNEYNHSRGTCISMDKNRECPAFLGIHVAERVLSNVFKDVVRMPNNNPGYDIICNHGKLIDVKAACSRAPGHPWENWHFVLRKNKIADYFLFLAFDNREDLNPLHVWLIPGDRVNHSNTANISISTLHKWDEYKLDIDKISSCCDIMKNGGN